MNIGTLARSLIITGILTLTACTAARSPSESEQANAIRDEATRLLAADDYDGLEKAAAQDRSTASPFGSGIAPISLFYEAIAGTPTPASPDTFKRELDELAAWVHARPDSVTAKIALADARSWSAWFARGGGYAPTVSDAGRQSFGDQLTQAADVLKQASSQRQTDPHWFYVAERVGRGMQWDKDFFFKVTDEGTTFFPQSVEIPSAAVIFLLPRWSGSSEEVVAYASKAADQLGGDEGDILYARLAKAVWGYTFDTNVFKMGFSWPRVKHGMDLICNRYPHSTIMLNYYGLFAYQAQDHDTAHRLFSQLGDRFEQGISSLDNHYMEGGPWWTKDDFEQARAWAQ